MTTDLLYDRSELLIFVVLLAMLLLAGEAGYRTGRRKSPSSLDPSRDPVSGIQGALLGLFALLLGFTFAMALGRFDTRRQMVVEEANAIGTAALRARLLPAEQRAETAELFRRYTAVRVEAARGPNLPTPERRELDREAARLQEHLWTQAAAAAEADPRSHPAALLLEALNELIDVKGERDAVLANHVPESVLLLLFAFAILNSAVLGYASGLARVRAFGAAAILSLLVALVILVIIDLDRPRRGLIVIDQSSMIELQESLEQP